MASKEQWEVDLRAKLELELEDGYYRFGGEKEGDLVFSTGKQGAIEFYISFERSIRSISYGVEPIIKECEEDKHDYLLPATEDDFIDIMNQLMKRKGRRYGK